MRQSKLFGRTLRDDPAEADLASHKLMLRAGLIHQVAAGVYSYLPLAWRSLRKIEQIIREEMDAADGQELRMAVLQPRSLWDQTSRYDEYGPEMFRLQDRRDRDLVLAPTHEEMLTTMVKANIHSYRDLPVTLYQIQTKFRDEARPRGGLLRVREFDMKDAYSFDSDEEGLDLSYQTMVQAYKKVFARCGLDAIIVDADSGTIGGKDSQEFILLADAGEDNIVMCESCGYAANAEKAAFTKTKVDGGPPNPLEDVHTPGIKTIDELTDLLGITAANTLKVVFYHAAGEVVIATIRGDLEVNETKLRNELGGAELRLASPEEVSKAGLVAGSASPVGLDGIKVIADDSVGMGSNFVVGANKEDYHLRNANYPRDFKADVVADIALAQDGYQCPNCDSNLAIRKGIEIGHVFKLGTKYSEPLGAVFTDDKGGQQSITMGSYGIGVGRLLAAAIEQHHDEDGMMLPASIAPYQVSLVALNTNKEDVVKAADDMYDALLQAGLTVLYDDRAESPGVKFKDSDLLGLPVRVVVSARNLRDGVVEVKARSEDDRHSVPQPEAIEHVKGLLA
jgi:prolyl-tRNA synthetase